MVSAVVASRDSRPVIGWIVDGLCAFMASTVMNVVFIVGVFAYAIGRAHTVRISGYLEILVDDKGGFEASTHDGVMYAVVALTVALLLVARGIRRVREREATKHP